METQVWFIPAQMRKFLVENLKDSKRFAKYNYVEELVTKINPSAWNWHQWCSMGATRLWGAGMSSKGITSWIDITNMGVQLAVLILSKWGSRRKRGKNSRMKCFKKKSIVASTVSRGSVPACVLRRWWEDRKSLVWPAHTSVPATIHWQRKEAFWVWKVDGR